MTKQEISELKEALSSPHIRNHQNYKPGKNHSGGGVSMTVPDQTMTIRQLIERHSRGLPVPGAKQIPEYDPEPLFPGLNVKTLDLQELHELKLAIQSELETIKSAREYAETERRKKLEREALKAEIEAEIAAQNQLKNKPVENQ